MNDALVANITALLGGVVPAIVLRHMYQNGSSDFRWIPSVVLLIIVAIVLQYLILVEPRPSYDAEAAEVEAAVDAAVEAADKLTGLVDEYTDALTPSADSPEYHRPTWNYYYNDGDSYVEGYSEVRLVGNTPYYQHKILIKCLVPDTLRVSPSAGYYDYSFSTEDSHLGDVTRVYARLDDKSLSFDNKVRVINGEAVIPLDDAPARLSNGALLELSLIMRADGNGMSPQDAVFVLRHFDHTWDECDRY